MFWTSRGAQIVDYAGMAVVGSSSGRSPRARIPTVYAFARAAVQRNLYRIPLR